MARGLGVLLVPTSRGFDSCAAGRENPHAASSAGPFDSGLRKRVQLAWTGALALGTWSTSHELMMGAASWR